MIRYSISTALSKATGTVLNILASKIDKCRVHTDKHKEIGV